MAHKYTLELLFLLLAIAMSVVGFSSLYTGEQTGPDAYQALHIITSFTWLLLLLGQLVVVRQHRFQLHRTVGMSIFLAGPVLVATLTMLSVHSAAKDAGVNRPDVLVVQNVMVTLEVALLVLLGFILRRNRILHGSLLMSTALLFMGIALFFTLISYVPGYRIEGPETFSRFADAAQTSSIVGSLIGVLLFLARRRNGWPWLLASSFFFANGFLQMYIARTDRTTALTQLVGSRRSGTCVRAGPDDLRGLAVDGVEGRARQTAAHRAGHESRAGLTVAAPEAACARRHDPGRPGPAAAKIGIWLP